MGKERGSHFDPDLLDRFIAMAPYFERKVPREERNLKAMLLAQTDHVPGCLGNQLPARQTAGGSGGLKNAAHQRNRCAGQSRNTRLTANHLL